MKNLCETRLAATSFFFFFFYVVFFFPFWPWGDNSNVKYYHLASRVGWFLICSLYLHFRIARENFSVFCYIIFFSFVRSFLLTRLFYSVFSLLFAIIRFFTLHSSHNWSLIRILGINKLTGLSFTFAHLRPHQIISSTVSFSNTLQHTPPTPYHIVVRVSSLPSSASAAVPN